MALVDAFIGAAILAAAAWFLWQWKWVALQFAIIIAFSIVGFFIGWQIKPGSSLSQWLAMAPMIVIGFFVARYTTNALSRFIDRRGERPRLRD